ncbi:MULTISPECIES: hypothetical protein [unclassified Kitasatospora]|uniref:hypothetical protein n=1 Tax=unclassified Kitasatospora TaxID=2633591 RepID=UPI0037F142B9
MGNSGGAAAHSGIDFQQRVAALAMCHMLCDLADLSLLGLDGAGRVEELRFETEDEIDDLVLVGPGVRYFVQAKNTISVSAAPTSDFGSVLGQFVRQYVTDSRPGDVYLLATSTEASARVRRELRKLTEAARLSRSSSAELPLNGAERDVLEKTEGLVRAHYETATGRAITAVELREILARIRVSSLDVREGGSLESAALLMLSVRSAIGPRLLWGGLIALAVSLARDRLAIDAEGLRARMGKYVRDHPEPPGPGASGLLNRETVAGLAFGREVVLAEASFEGYELVIADFRRFDEAGAKRVTFADGHVEWAPGERWRVVGRWATWAGLERHLENRAEEYRDRRVLIIPATFTDDPSDAPAARAHAEHCANLAERVEDAFGCRHCGDAVSEAGAPLIEVDEEGRPEDIGLVHEECLRPTDRVLGGVDGELLRENPRLRNFDYAGWIAALQGGQWMFGGIARAQLPVARIAWKSEYDDFSRGGWCVRISLEDGGANYVTDRGRVARRSERRAAEGAERMNADFAAARRSGDPWCYTPDGSGFAPYSRLLRQGEEPIPCVRAKAVRYTRAIGEAYSDCRRYYAPLAYLVDAETGDPVVVDGVITLLTDPLELDSYVRNWARSGVELPEFTVAGILSDEQFDRFVRLAMTRGTNLVVNPKLALDGSLVSGYLLDVFEDLTRGAAPVL